MTTSVADETPISAKVWRRHQDPPGLWIVVAIASVSLHLLAFWLMRSSNAFRPWFPNSNQAIAPIELVEISPKESTTKAQPQTSAPQTKIPNQQSVDFGSSVEPENQPNVSQPDTPVFQETPEPETTSTPTPEPTPSTPTPEPETTSTPTPEPTPSAFTPTPTIPFGERPWENRQDIELGKATPLPSNTPTVTPEEIAKSPAVEDQLPRTQNTETANTSSQETPPTPDADTTSNPGDDNSPTPGETANNSNVDTSTTSNGDASNNSNVDTSPNPETTNSPNVENSPIANAGGFIANVLALGDNEVRQFIQEGRIRNRDIPDVFAVYQGSTTKPLDNSSSYLPSNSQLQPAQLLVSIIVDQNGKFQQAEVLELPPNLQSEKSAYEQLINDLFQNDTCTPAKNRDGTSLDLSNCYIQVDIKAATAN